MIEIKHFLEQHFDQVLRQWLSLLTQSWQQEQKKFNNLNLQQQCRSMLSKYADAFDNPKSEEHQDLVELLNEVGAFWAAKGLSSSETSKFIITLKQSFKQLIISEHNEITNDVLRFLQQIDQTSDELLLICQDAYTNSREKLIRQQSAALLELSSPVVKMWDKILLLPLIGVIDTVRAKQITESLLTEITRREAIVTVLDMTGVPVFDTAVAGHIFKTISAAHMLGCKVILTGISSDGALVLTKLGIEFKNVITRGNLHSGVKAAFDMRGLYVANKQGNADEY